MRDRVSDEVWRRLDPNAGRLRGPLSGRTSVVLAALIPSLAVAVWWSGLIVPKLVWPNGSWWAESTPGGTVYVHVEVANGGVVPATVLRAGDSGPGYQLIGLQGSLPAELGRGESVPFTLVYRVTDCDALPHGSFALPVVIRRFWGEQTVDVNRHHEDLIIDQMCRPH
jgi:hypothetical protein